MGARSRKRKAQRGWLVPLLMPLIRAVAQRVQKARPRAAYRLAVNLGVLFGWLGVTRQVVRRNLRLACGRGLTGRELRRFEARYYRHLALLLIEFLRQPTLTRANLERHFEPEGLRRARRIYDRGQGVIFVAGHAGAWELAGHAAGLLGINLLSVAKLSGYEQLDAWVTGIRESGGQRIRDVRGSMWAMKKALDRGEAVGINVDQEARLNITFAPFFGIPAATSSAPAQLHLKTGAPIAVVTAHREAPFRYAIRVFDEIRHQPSGEKQEDLEFITTRINAAMEEALRQHPDQWLWSHRRWRRRPPSEDPENPFQRVTATPGLELGPAQTEPNAP